MDIKQDRSPLELRFRGRIIEHLGLQLYSQPVNAIAEIIANAWDAEAERVDVVLPEKIEPGSVIVVTDDGVGMTRDECQRCFLEVGANRRKNNPAARSKHNKRAIMGRKGIGKFAGFGIAQTITIETLSEDNNLPTMFILDGASLMADDGEGYVNTRPFELEERTELSQPFQRNHGTRVILSDLTLQKGFNAQSFSESMSRRFFLNASQDNFAVFINERPMPDDIELQNCTAVYPRDYPTIPNDVSLLENGWGEENISNGKEQKPIQWRIAFFEKPLKGDDALKGVSIFANKKLVQRPFFFNLSGGFEGQTGLEYMAGRVVADFLDQQETELVSTDRQGVNWERTESLSLKIWGARKVRELCKLWAAHRSAHRRELVEKKVNRYQARLDRLDPQKRRVAEKVLKRLASIDELEDEHFIDMSDAVLTAFETDILKTFIEELDSRDSLTEIDVLRLFQEANVLTALYMVQLVGVKLGIMAKLHKMICKSDPENDVRDLIAENPWIVGPQWETYKVETSLSAIKKEAASKAHLDDGIKQKRIDLALSSGNSVLLLEFMKPGLTLDKDHVIRLEDYFYAFRGILAQETNDPEKTKKIEKSYLVAETDVKSDILRERITAMKKNGIYVLSWHQLFNECIRQWKDVLEAFVEKAPDDPRIKELEEYLKL